jgi:hypothetical protein
LRRFLRYLCRLCWLALPQCVRSRRSLTTICRMHHRPCQTIKPEEAGAASVSGTVLDTSGAAISGAEITLTENRRSQVRSTSTGTDGSFVFRSLAPGSYTIIVKANGFQQSVSPEFTLTQVKPAPAKYLIGIDPVRPRHACYRRTRGQRLFDNPRFSSMLRRCWATAEPSLIDACWKCPFPLQVDTYPTCPLRENGPLFMRMSRWSQPDAYVFLQRSKVHCDAILRLSRRREIESESVKEVLAGPMRRTHAWRWRKVSSIQPPRDQVQLGLHGQPIVNELNHLL